MTVSEEIRETMLASMAQVFEKTEEELSVNADADLLDELKATSQQYFPIIAALEEQFDIELQYQDFRREGRTINKAIEFVEDVYRKTYGD